MVPLELSTYEWVHGGEDFLFPVGGHFDATKVVAKMDLNFSIFFSWLHWAVLFCHAMDLFQEHPLFPNYFIIQHHRSGCLELKKQTK